MSDQSFTGMTDFMFQSASSGVLTLREAVDMLKRDAHFRTVRETLARYCNIDRNDPDALRKEVVRLLTESDPEVIPDSAARKVRGWLKDDVRSISRESAVQLAFALRLTVPEAERLLERLCGEGLHWRDPVDIVWIFGLSQGMTWQEAKALQAHAASLRPSASAAEERADVMTETVRHKVMQLRTQAELEAFLKDAANELGSYHNTAYSLFIAFLSLLGDAPMDDLLTDEHGQPLQERKMPVREIMSTYLYDRYIPRARAKGREKYAADVQSAIERDIRQNWPDEFALSRMYHRETDVTRKVMILLFLACDGGESAYGDLSDENPEDVFADMYLRLSTMLADCGFSPLDSRTPFDWMVLYCMAADDSVLVDDNVRQFLGEIFSDSAPEEQ